MSQRVPFALSLLGSRHFFFFLSLFIYVFIHLFTYLFSVMSVYLFFHVRNRAKILILI